MCTINDYFEAPRNGAPYWVLTERENRKIQVVGRCVNIFWRSRPKSLRAHLRESPSCAPTCGGAPDFLVHGLPFVSTPLPAVAARPCHAAGWPYPARGVPGGVAGGTGLGKCAQHTQVQRSSQRDCGGRRGARGLYGVHSAHSSVFPIGIFGRNSGAVWRPQAW